MAYVPGFTHDVFISFTHVDNKAVSGPDGWVTLFERTLNALLPQRLPERREVDIFRDPRIGSNEVLGEKIDATVSRSAALVCVMSPQYLKADWCRREIATFWTSRHLGLGPQINESLRVFKVFIQSTESIRQAELDWDEYPSLMRETLGKSFFETAPANPSFSQLALPRGLDSLDQRFLLQMERLVGDIARQLEVMRRIANTDAGIDAPPTQNGLGPVYLAEVTDDLEDDSRKLRQELIRLGIRVLPEDSLSNNREDAEEEIRRALDQSQLAVHLFSSAYGRALKGDKHSLPHLQYLLSREYAQAKKLKLGRLAWIDDKVVRPNVSPAQQELLALVEDEPEGEASIDFQSGPLQRLKESIQKKLVRRKGPTLPWKRRAMIYVTGKADDMSLPDTDRLVQFLKREHDVMKSATPDDEDGERVVRRHEKYCQNSDGLLLLYGNADADWVQDKAFDIRQMSERRREKPLAAAVYEAPPEKEEDLPIDFQSVIKLDGSRGFDPDCLQPFLDLVKQADDPLTMSQE